MRKRAAKVRAGRCSRPVRCQTRNDFVNRELAREQAGQEFVVRYPSGYKAESFAKRFVNRKVYAISAAAKVVSRVGSVSAPPFPFYGRSDVVSRGPRKVVTPATIFQMHAKRSRALPSLLFASRFFTAEWLH